MNQWDVVKSLVEAAPEKYPFITAAILFIIGAGCILLSFYEVSLVNTKCQFNPSAQPNWYIFVFGSLCIAAGLSSLAIGSWLILQIRGFQLDATIKPIDNGFRLVLSSSLMIDIIRGEIQKISIDNSHAAVVLPANTSFDDECIHDKRSALGAFFEAHFPQGISQIQNAVRSEATNLTGHKENHPTGTTVFLDKPLGSRHRILVAAVTTFSKEEGIKADTLSVITSVKNIFKTAVRQRLSELYIPVLGTGHGGLGFSVALFLILLQTIHCVMCEGAHPIKHVVIVVYDPENRRQRQIKRIIQSVKLIMEE